MRRASLIALAATVLLSPGEARAQASTEGERRPPGLPAPAHSPLRAPAPTIQITSPPADATFHDETLRVTGAVTSQLGVADVDVTVNGRPFPLRDFERGSRLVTIEARVDLVPGDNVIRIAVRDSAGRGVSMERRVRRSLVVGDAPERWAVVIGVRKYDHTGIPARRFAENDARSVGELLTRRAGFKAANIRVLHEASAERPTLGNMNDALGKWLTERAGPRDSVLIYFSGRGAKDDERAYLLPRDADPALPETTALDLERLDDLLKRLRAKQVLIVLDVPFRPVPGSFAGTNIEQQFLSLLTRRSGLTVISASGENEEALELAALKHGLFTHYLIRAFDGSADSDRDGVLTGGELVEHLQRSVADHAHNLGTRQRPVVHGSVADVPPIVVEKRPGG